MSSLADVRQGPLRPDLMPAVPTVGPGEQSPILKNRERMKVPIDAPEGKRVYRSAILNYLRTYASEPDTAVQIEGRFVKAKGRELFARFENGVLVVDIDSELDKAMQADHLKGNTFFSQDDIIRDAERGRMDQLKAILVQNPDLIEKLRGDLSDEDAAVLKILVAKSQMEQPQPKTPDPAPKQTSPAPNKK